MVNKADVYLRETLLEISEEGQVDKEPRPKYADGEPAHSKFITQKVFQYDISKGEFPITTLRTTALKGGWFDIEAIYLKQTNIVEEMNPAIHSWWKDFVVKVLDKKELQTRWLDWAYFKKEDETYGDKMPINFQQSSLGQTYGHTVKRYDLMDKLLKGLKENPFGRRHTINLNQEQQKIDDPKALTPCAFETLWSVRDLPIGSTWSKWNYETGDVEVGYTIGDIRYIDLTLVQRSMDLAVTSSINPAQYVMFAMAVCNHLTFVTGIKHEVGKLLHIVQNCHVYLRHMNAVSEILDRRPTERQPKIKLICEPKYFYSHTIEDFEFSGLEGIEKLSTKLEIAI
tara:strand:- start:942 stop:1964 length:1023 start_codon:yes stop_codon:yes gene_type:complete